MDSFDLDAEEIIQFLSLREQGDIPQVTTARMVPRQYTDAFLDLMGNHSLQLVPGELLPGMGYLEQLPTEKAWSASEWEQWAHDLEDAGHPFSDLIESEG